MRAHWDSHLERHGVEMPTSHKVHLTYKDTSGQTYEEVSVIDLGAMDGSVFTEVKTLHDVGKSLDEIRKVLKDAPLLSRHGSVNVQAVTESHEANEMRLALEEYQSLHDSLRSMEGWRKSRPDVVAGFEDRIARMEDKYPSLAGHKTGRDGALRSRVRASLERLKSLRRGVAL